MPINVDIFNYIIEACGLVFAIMGLFISFVSSRFSVRTSKHFSLLFFVIMLNIDFAILSNLVDGEVAHSEFLHPLCNTLEFLMYNLVTYAFSLLTLHTFEIPKKSWAEIGIKVVFVVCLVYFTVCQVLGAVFADTNPALSVFYFVDGYYTRGDLWLPSQFLALGMIAIDLIVIIKSKKAVSRRAGAKLKTTFIVLIAIGITSVVLQIVLNGMYIVLTAIGFGSFVLSLYLYLAQVNHMVDQNSSLAEKERAILEKERELSVIRTELALIKLKPERYKHGIYIQALGNFAVFKDGVPISFARSKSKEMLAYLVDRNGSDVSKKELAAVLFEDSEYSDAVQNYMTKIYTDLVKSLSAVGAEDILVKGFNMYAVDKTKFFCDAYDYFLMVESRQNYRGEYMSQYSWADCSGDDE